MPVTIELDPSFNDYLHHIQPPDWEKAQKAFEPYEDDIVRFSDKHQLEVDRWYHDIPMWALREKDIENQIGTVIPNVQIHYYDGRLYLFNHAYMKSKSKEIVYQHTLREPARAFIGSWNPGDTDIKLGALLEEARGRTFTRGDFV